MADNELGRGFWPVQVTPTHLAGLLSQAARANWITIGGSAGGGGGGAVISDGTKMTAKQTANGVWEFTVDSSVKPGTSQPTTISVPASKAPAMVDGPGTDADYVTLYAVPGVKWRVAAPATTVGTEYNASWFGGASSKNAPVTTGGVAEITAVAEPGYVISGRSAWQLTFTNVATKTTVTIPAAAAPVGSDQPGMDNDTVTLTKVDGVTWVVDGVDHPSSGFSGNTKVVKYAKGVDATVMAKGSTADIVISGTSSWNLRFTNVTPPTGGGGGGASAPGWKAAFPKITLAGVADENPIPKDVWRLGTGSTSGYKNAAGTPIISGEKFVIPTATDGVVAFAAPTVQDRVRVSWTAGSNLDGYRRHVVYGWGGAFGSAPTNMGIVATASNKYTLTESSYIDSTMTPRTDGPEFSFEVGDTITLELDSTTNTLVALVNGSKVAEMVSDRKILKVRGFAFKSNVYTIAQTVFDDVLLEIPA